MARCVFGLNTWSRGFCRIGIELRTRLKPQLL
jgi:hypothetical protein